MYKSFLKNQITTKLTWLLSEPPRLLNVCLSLWPVLSLHHRNCFSSPSPPLISQSRVSRECEHEVRERLLHSLAHVSIQTPYGVQGSQGRRGGRGRPCPGSPHHWTEHQTGILRARPPFPPTPTQVEGEQLSPEPMLVKVSAQHRANISGEPGMTITCIGRVLIVHVPTLVSGSLTGDVGQSPFSHDETEV